MTRVNWSTLPAEAVMLVLRCGMAASASPDESLDDPSPADLIASRPHLAMHAMDGLLLDDVPLNRIADAVGTPTWVYSSASIRTRYRALRDALNEAGLHAQPHYAVKAND